MSPAAKQPMFTVIEGHRRSLPEGATTRREAPRPPELRQPGYMEDFDDDSLWFEVFAGRDGIHISGPPLLNLTSVLASAQWLLDGRDVSDQVTLADWGHAQASVIRGASGRKLHVKTDECVIETDVTSNFLDSFAGSYAIFTKSKNNDLAWIRDWLEFHVRAHGVSAALIYDNGSDRYGPDDVLETMHSVSGLHTGVVVSWPYKFGPKAGTPKRFDSDFFQYVVASDAQHRFLGRAAGVIQADIDELVMTEDGRTVFEHAEESESGYLPYLGRVVEGVLLTDAPARSITFKDFGYYDPAKPLSTPKWTCIPQKLPPNVQWRTHAINGVAASPAEQVIHRHFWSISTSWKFNRAVRDLDVGQLTLDERLLDAMRLAYPDEVVAARHG